MTEKWLVLGIEVKERFICCDPSFRSRKIVLVLCTHERVDS
jgi:hypothetical protein